MKRFLIVIVLVHFSLYGFTQVIQGIVLDHNTKDTIPFATVYFSGTFEGTYTDQHGRFSIDLAGRTAMPLTISSIGYYSEIITEFPLKIIKVQLKPKVYEMKEIVINAKSLTQGRESNMRHFKREFLGISPYARKCVILNENDITFNYGNDADTLQAYAKNALQIYNPLLGYKLLYYLDEFKFCRATYGLKITGSVLFDQDLTDSLGAKVMKRRRHAYLGSPMHFFRSLYANTLEKDGFYGNTAAIPLNVVNVGANINVYEATVSVTDSIKYFFFNRNLSIYYRNNPSYAKFLSSPVAFNEKGHYDYTRISWDGKMADYRVGDWLPLEYKP